MFKTDTLTCFELGQAYLMVELDDLSSKESHSIERIKTCIRMNVPDVKLLANRLMQKKTEVDYKEYSWGIVAKFFDPDGNLCAFKDSEKFELQIKAHKI